ncbi:MAG: hypothetical protein CM15mP129_00180 [Chloroflexota bacterium]|nr:MAG: hypothetical protein CM15mP129_00180 [Chloroflexota bacterium]
MKADEAWNYGISIINSFKLFGKESQLTLDYYITDFENKVVADWETPTQINFYNLIGKAFQIVFKRNFLTPFQIQLIYCSHTKIQLQKQTI